MITIVFKPLTNYK